MALKSLSLQNFRNYKKASFDVSPNLTLIVGKNTAGKTNFIEAIYYLSHGKSFKTEKDIEAIFSGKEIGKVSALTDTTKLEVILANLPERFSKRLLVNGISRRRGDFMGNLLSVLFSPEDLNLIIGSPYLRRSFLNDVLEQIDKEYRFASIAYDKALRQRNSLLQKIKETGIRKREEFIYWDNLLIKNGQVITKKREDFIQFINRSKKKLFVLKAVYDHSKISEERLLEYKEAEEGSGVTLVGPHRDDFFVLFEERPPFAKASTDDKSLADRSDGQGRNLKSFGSRGQQRL
ncbi:MAG: DNA replication and repair protein RecF, partial [Candidatus Levybacteria bacterium]|nr:DNA replication and repair protein RecF [Candidatus Levybacteria bacterium]